MYSILVKQGVSGDPKFEQVYKTSAVLATEQRESNTAMLAFPNSKRE